MQESTTNQIPELPSLDPGVQLLHSSESAIGPLHTLVLDEILQSGGTAVWIDAHNYGTSHYLAEVAPSMRVLDRVRIARGFTPYQHQTLIEDATTELDADTAIIVAPAVDGLYRTDDVRGAEPQTMLLQSLSRLARYARAADIPVLVTRTAADDFSRPIARVATNEIDVVQTQFGPRFQGSEFETLVYTSGTQTMQTTFAYWQRLLAARQPVHEVGISGEPATGTV